MELKYPCEKPNEKYELKMSQFLSEKVISLLACFSLILTIYDGFKTPNLGIGIFVPYIKVLVWLFFGWYMLEKLIGKWLT